MPPMITTRSGARRASPRSRAGSARARRCDRAGRKPETTPASAVNGPSAETNAMRATGGPWRPGGLRRDVCSSVTPFEPVRGPRHAVGGVTSATPAGVACSCHCKSCRSGMCQSTVDRTRAYDARVRCTRRRSSLWLAFAVVAAVTLACPAGGPEQSCRSRDRRRAPRDETGSRAHAARQPVRAIHDKNAFGRYTELRYPGLRVSFQGNSTVTNVSTTRRSEHTARGVGVGVTEADPGRVAGIQCRPRSSRATASSAGSCPGGG